MLKYVNTGIVFQEIPDEVTLAINISNCPCHCPGCHSHYLWEDIGLPLDTDAIDQFVKLPTALFGDGNLYVIWAKGDSMIEAGIDDGDMGGDCDPKGVDMLAQYIHEVHPEFKVAWYSGRVRVSSCVCKTDFDYIKIGPYLRHLGSLKKPTTNQRLYRQTDDGTFEDITSRFWHH